MGTEKNRKILLRKREDNVTREDDREVTAGRGERSTRKFSSMKIKEKRER